MARENYPLGASTYTRNNGFSNEYLVSPFTMSSASTNVTGAIGSSQRPVRISQYTMSFTNGSDGGVVRLRIADSSSGLDGYSDATTTTGRGDRTDYPNLAKFAGDTVYYGFSKGDATTTEFYAGGGGIIYARRGSTVSGRQLKGNFLVDTVPSAPLLLQAAAQTSSTVFLSWNAPSDTGGIPLSGYRVLKSSDGSNWSYATNTSATQVTVTGLTANTNWRFKVAAHNNISQAHGGGVTDTGYHTGTNADASARTPTDALPPTAEISGSSVSQSQVGVTWSSSEGSAAPTSVTVVRDDTGQILSYSASGSTTVSGLTPNTTYYYTINVSNAQGSASEQGSGRTLNYTPALSISATAIDSTSARVVWNSSNADTVSVSGTGLNSTAQSGNEIITGLTPGGIYSWAGDASNNDFSVSTTSNRIQLPNVIGGVWNGADWALPNLTVWNGSTWADTESYVWTGTSWKFWA
jgi:chitodextrinase